MKLRLLTICLILSWFSGTVLNAQVPKETLFPQDNYTPYGYLDNPYHSFIINKSGAIRCVPPLGYGFWCRSLPWPYGGGAKCDLNYLSLMDFAVVQDGKTFISEQDFKDNGVTIHSSYHSKNLMNYKWTYNNVDYEFVYFLISEHSLGCQVSVTNNGPSSEKISLSGVHTYGYPESNWWGSDGFTTLFNEEQQVSVAKIWAYGDVYIFGSDIAHPSYKATLSSDELEKWISSRDLSVNDGAISHSPDPVYSMLSTELDLPTGETKTVNYTLTRGKNEKYAMNHYAMDAGHHNLVINQKVGKDNDFYRKAPILTGGWPEKWRRGWIYHYETLRMNIREPLGIYHHYWDAMQPFTPRVVLGETSLDAMCMSYADDDMAKDMLLGVFKDAIAVNIPCSREDGSMNMIAADGKECGTAPIWGMPFLVIRSIFERTGDVAWLSELYPYMKSYLKWWLDNRTDEEGFFHAANSWESGQDASRRFLVEGVDPGSASSYVRTVDIEAAMAHGMQMMEYFAAESGHPEDVAWWHSQLPQRIRNVQSMFVDGWFRDFDARNGKPIILKDYWDIMMFMPASLNLVSDLQKKELEPMFLHFREHPRHFMEWPSFLFPFTEAAWNSNYTIFNAEEVGKIGNRVYAHLDDRQLHPVLIKSYENLLPEKYSYRIPGIGDEFWPLKAENPGGCENYGWGATLPTLIIRNIIGFRECLEDSDSFILAPAVPENISFTSPFGIDNLKFKENRINLTYDLLKGEKVRVMAEFDEDIDLLVRLDNKIIYDSSRKSASNKHVFMLRNGVKYQVEVIAR